MFRRLFLDRILPAPYERIVSIDSDMLIRHAGLGRLAEFDLGGAPIAAAYDMIFLMDFNGGALARRFQRHRRSLGLADATPYFNAGLMAIDRARWSALDLGERAMAALRRIARALPFPRAKRAQRTDRRRLCAAVAALQFHGRLFSARSGRASIDPIVLHFVNDPKPWDLDRWRGEARFARAYQAWFAASPWPDYLAKPPVNGLARRKPRTSAARRAFADRLTAFLATRPFIDGQTAQAKA